MLQQEVQVVVDSEDLILDQEVHTQEFVEQQEILLH
jgi:hypothetical protein